MLEYVGLNCCIACCFMLNLNLMESLGKIAEMEGLYLIP